MRGQICSRRNRGAVNAANAEEERVFAAANANAPATTTTAAAGGRGGSSPSAPAAGPPAPAAVAVALLSERVHFDPGPVFVGPKPGWTGPVLAARPTADIPPDATAYTGEKTPALDPATQSSAPVAIQGAVHIPPPKARVVARPSHLPITTAVARERRIAAASIRRLPPKKQRVN
jgi:hypothetical protein